MKIAALGDLLAVSDSGTWGDEGKPHIGDAVLRSTNIQDSRLVLDDVAWRVLSAKDRERRVLKTGDILVTKSSGSADHIGKCCLFVEPSGGRRFYFSNFTLRLRADEVRGDPRWVFYWLSSAMGRAGLARINNTTTGLRNLDVARYLAQPIPTPPLPEQRRMADILDKADAIRRKRKEAIALTEELLRSAFLEMFGDPVTNPKGWEVKPLGEVIEKLEAGWSANGEARQRTADEYGVLKVSAVTSGFFRPDEHKAVAEALVDRDLVTPRAGDLLFSRANTRELVAASCLVERDEPQLFLPDKIWRVIPRVKLAVAPYIRFLLAHERFRGELTKTATGTSGSMLNVSMEKLRALRAPIPPVSTQERFANLVWKTLKAKALRELAQQSTNELFASLVHRAFRGELAGANDASEPQLGLLDAGAR